ncbi:MAG: PAS domain S-box protein [Bacteroidia bacterium]|nr:PAS domain S-box protein [Bacteroidia bacterium]
MKIKNKMNRAPTDRGELHHTIKKNYLMMNLRDKTKDELIKELQKLQQKYDSLKTSYSKDITERKQAKHKLRESEARFRSYFDLPLHSIAITSPEKGWIEVNSRICSILGYTWDELARITWVDITHPDDLAADDEQFNRLLSGEIEQYTLDKRFIRKDGVVVWTSIAVGCVRESDGNVDYVVAYMEDINERKRAEEALHESEERFRRLSQGLFEGIIIHDEGKIIDANEAFAAMSGYDLPELIGKNALDFATPELREIAERHIRTESEEPYEGMSLRKEGSMLYVEVRSKNIPYKGRMVRVTALVDITERKRAEKALRESEGKYRELIDNIGEGVGIIDSEENFVFTNQAAEKIFGVGHGGLVGTALHRFLSPENLELVIKQTNERRKRISSIYEHEIILSSGIKKHIIITATPKLDSNGEFLGTFAIFRDITKRRQAEKALRDSEERFRRLYQQAPLGYQSLDAEGCFIDVNQAWLDLLGYSRDEVIGRWFGDFLAPQEVDVFKQRFTCFKVTGEVHVDLEMVQRTGSKIIVHIDGKIGHDEHGQFKQTHCILYNITEHKQAEDALRQSEMKLKTLFEELPIGVSILDAERNVTFVNPALERILNITKDGFIRGDYKSRKYFRPDGTQMPEEEFASVRAFREQRAVHNVETGVLMEDGHVIWTNVNAAPVAFPDWKVVIITMDITERKLIEETLRESEERFRRLSQGLFEGIIIHDEGKIIDTNEAFADMFGYDLPELIGKNSLDFAAPELRKIAEHHILTESEEPYEGVAFRKEGSTLDVEVRGKNIPYEGRMVRVTALMDITERKRAEEALRLEKENFRHSLDDSPLGVRIATIEGNTIYANKALLDFYGYDSLGELQKTPLKDRYTPESYAQAQKRKHQREHGDLSATDYKISIVRKNGEIRHLEVFRKDVLWDGVRQFQVICNDITERKHAEEALHESEERYRRLVEGSPEAIAVHSKGRFVFVNPAGAKLIGARSPQELIGKPVLNVIHPDSRSQVIERLRHVAEGKEAPLFEEKFLKFDGSVIDVEVVGIPFPYQGQIATQVVVHDITERKQAEEEIRKSKRLLEDLHKHLNEVLENERALISREIHDQIGQSLTALKLDINRMQEFVGSNPEAFTMLRGMIELVTNTIKDVQRISSDLRPGILDDLGLVSAIEWYCDEFRERTGIKCNLKLDVSFIGDSQKNLIFFRVLQETLTNVIRHAMASSVNIKLLQSDRGTTLTIQDNGIGIPKEKIESHKSLGIINMRERVKQFNGKIDFSSKKGEGTKLTIFIPS